MAVRMGASNDEFGTTCPRSYLKDRSLQIDKTYEISKIEEALHQTSRAKRKENCMRHMRKASVVLIRGTVIALLMLASTVAAEPPPSARPLTRLNVGSVSVDWLPSVDYERLVLTIVG